MLPKLEMQRQKARMDVTRVNHVLRKAANRIALRARLAVAATPLH